SLEKDDLVQIIDLMLIDLNTMLAQEGVTIDVSKEVKEQLIELGYDPKFGARPLRRTIQEHLEDAIADSLIDQPEAKKLNATLNDDKNIVITEQVTV
ncbi:negative regulator of genetic competence ClpC/MecB, partial [Listeria innocua FSL J1-023]